MRFNRSKKARRTGRRLMRGHSYHGNYCQPCSKMEVDTRSEGESFRVGDRGNESEREGMANHLGDIRCNREQGNIAKRQKRIKHTRWAMRPLCGLARRRTRPEKVAHMASGGAQPAPCWTCETLGRVAWQRPTRTRGQQRRSIISSFPPPPRGSVARSAAL